MGMGNMEIDRRAFIASLGGMAVVDAMDSETCLLYTSDAADE